ncbi:ATP synthase subunit delta [bacterium HR19]|nr:ATP synthase subunit delta [bacterium HR19]
MIAEKYARALVLAGKDMQELDKIYHDMKIFQELFSSESVKFVISSPSYSRQRKLDFISSIARDKNFSPITENFLKLVIKKRREGFLDDILRYSFLFYYNEKNIEKVTLISASHPDNQWLDELKKALEDSLKKKVEIEVKVDESLIGGFEIIGNGWRISSSVKSFLSSIQLETR